MICPHCNKEIEKGFQTKQITSEILNLLKDKSYSIAELSKKLNVKRDAMRYYLSLLIQEQKIFMKRQFNTPGQPQKISLVGEQ